MLYISGDTSETWPCVARALATARPLDMVAFAYPGEPLPAPFRPSKTGDVLEAATTWDDDGVATSSEREPVDEVLIAALVDLPTDVFEAEWDLALYGRGESEWVAYAIPHERIVLVPDELQPVLEAAGVEYASQPPEGW